MTKQPFKNFDLPTKHFNMNDGRHYIPEPSRDSTEIDRRKALPKNTILLEDQRLGLLIARDIIRYPFDDPQERDYAMAAIAMANINASAYTYAQDAPDVMRRRLDLPVLADDTTGWRQSRQGLLHLAEASIDHTVKAADELLRAHTAERATRRHHHNMGRITGNNALILAQVEVGNAPRGLDDFQIQDMIRQRSLSLLEQARAAADEVGQQPSVAALADPRSDYSRWLARNAPRGNEFYNALDQAQNESV